VTEDQGRLKSELVPDVDVRSYDARSTSYLKSCAQIITKRPSIMRILWFHFVKSRQMVQYLFLIEQCPTAITMPKVKIGHLMSFHILSKFIIHKSPIIQCYQPGTLKTVLTSEPNIHFFNILKYPLQNIIYNRFQVQQIPLFCLRMCKRSVKYPRPFVSFAVKHFCTKEECYSSLYI